jgi:radical SAM superfamily enzyme YgiQ (UPF0313 family)
MLIEIGTEIEVMILGARVDSADKKLYAKMKKANVKFVGYGIESGNQDVLDFYHKDITLQQIRTTIQLAKDMGFFTYGSFILGAPCETEKHFKNTITFACSLPLDIADFGPLFYQKGSFLWNQAVQHGNISKHEYSVTADSRKGLGHFTSEELDRVLSNAFKHFYLRPRYLFNQMHGAFSRKNLGFLVHGLKFLSSL